MVETLDRMVNRGQDAILLFGRVALAAIFVDSVRHKLMDMGAFTAMLAGQGVPSPEIAAVVGAAVELLGAAGVVLGFRTRLAALLLIVFTAGATVIAHHYWTLEGPARIMQAIHFMKNVSIIGGFLVLMVAGPGRFSLDRRRAR